MSLPPVVIVSRGKPRIREKICHSEWFSYVSWASLLRLPCGSRFAPIALALKRDSALRSRAINQQVSNRPVERSRHKYNLAKGMTLLQLAIRLPHIRKRIDAGNADFQFSP
jgi:hypothetical protein